MKKVFIIHGFKGWPNGGWRSWLMSELDKKEIYACSIFLPNPNNPSLKDWTGEISRYIKMNKGDEIYLVGHSLGVTAILRCLENIPENISGAVLVSGPIKPVENNLISSFLSEPFDFEKIRSKALKFLIIHGDNDSRVPFENAQILSKGLGCNLTVIKNGGHLTGSEGWKKQPQVLAGLVEMMRK